ncbi:hypothetical protein L3V77_16025 [Vibrio sp. DW001]|uniref:hypothetical protein n=1 Tax=Vibrio sp. DW001 TaxID=2912315 RepID=UPI0023AEA4A4|nr:hypothetical protein [Vibrio sp. DW001]WED26480.1 hypothetical protein L3V77_16020 [Vibrio sp. DW001]WED26481.1 hypothetical protein L3V77_16025 [Vibrio sp. DW001]
MSTINAAIKLSTIRANHYYSHKKTEAINFGFLLQQGLGFSKLCDLRARRMRGMYVCT